MLKFKLSHEALDIIREDIPITEADMVALRKDGYELIIPSPYIRRIPADRDENLKKAQAIIKEIKNDSNHN